MIKHGFTNRLKTLSLTFLIALVSLGCTRSQVEVNGKPQAVPKMSAPTEWQFSQLWINDLPLGASIKASGEVLISQPEGFVRILDDHVLPMNQLMIGVHGYASEGYEWVAPMVQLAHNNGLTYFYRWDWTNCPEEAGQRLAHGIEYLYSLYPEVEEIVLFAHSYGGVIATMAAGSIQVPISVVIHTIASPLAGYKRLMDQCDLTYDDAGKLVYPPFADHIYHFQWLTQKDQDGAFRMLATDPQVIDLPKSNVTRLPVSMDGHRLGHNWSVTWVVDTYLGIPHAP